MSHSMPEVADLARSTLETRDHCRRRGLHCRRDTQDEVSALLRLNDLPRILLARTRPSCCSERTLTTQGGGVRGIDEAQGLCAARWQRLEATPESGVCSTLSIPVLEGSGASATTVSRPA